MTGNEEFKDIFNTLLENLKENFSDHFDSMKIEKSVQRLERKSKPILDKVDSIKVC